MRLRHWWYLVPAIRKFLDLYRHAQHDPAFVRGHFSVVDPWTMMNFSIWTDRRAMLLWSSANRHVSYVRWAHHHSEELWSSEWRLAALSRGAQTWSGVVPLSTIRHTDDFQSERSNVPD